MSGYEPATKAATQHDAGALADRGKHLSLMEPVGISDPFD